jgi:hypothetical protein
MDCPQPHPGLQSPAPRLSNSMESAKAKFGGFGRGLKDRFERLDAKVQDAKALAEAKTRLSDRAASLKRWATGPEGAEGAAAAVPRHVACARSRRASARRRGLR